MRLRTSTVRKLLCEIDRAVELQATIVVDIDVQCLEVSRSVDESDVARLHEIVGDDDVFLVGRDFDIMWADGRLHRSWIVEAFDIGEV